uniref:Uncharacterized protein n=1 Tax=Eutreptiella gymnastica TaxID=73025 RepID=A0A7S1NAF2_9EUGL|mmetsp:Transcript_145045/g.252965  ORF Transcript_145045/g.252965 Transcript_145045/m.252965 type:complete len:237 (+) Transcript_145045:3-713(+)
MELEPFNPRGGIRDLIASTANPRRVYKMGKFSSNGSEIVWDYHKEKEPQGGWPGMKADEDEGIEKFAAQIAEADGDAVEKRVTGDVHLHSTTLAMDPDTTVALRFTGVDIPQGALIYTATLVFVAAEARKGDCYIQIYAEASDDAKRFSEKAINGITARVRTSAKLLWRPTSWLADQVIESDSVKEVVQEVVNRKGWAEGNAMAFFLTTIEGTRDCWAWNKDPKKSCGLVVEWGYD